jgi:hypothetical protein
MKTWVQKNFHQIVIALLSCAVALVLHYKPEYHDPVIIMLGALAAVGLHLQPITYGPQPPTVTIPVDVAISAKGIAAEKEDETK